MINKSRLSVINPIIWMKYLEPQPDKEQIQPNGIDLRVNKVYYFKSKSNSTPIFSKNKREGYPVELVNPVYDKELKSYFWDLEGNTAYIIEYVEKVKIPENAMGLIFPRSSLWRLYGARVYTSVWDSGYQGYGKSLLKTFKPFRLEKGTPISQLVLFTADKARTYNGIYQNEGL
ncbi:MAG: dCTP deaminase domain-containing protein [Candidatus Odinarchaeia archaeon]